MALAPPTYIVSRGPHLRHQESYHLATTPFPVPPPGPPGQYIARAKKHLLLNISPSDTVPGTVIASPSTSYPDYYYHWTRDAALVMDTVLTLHIEDGDMEEKMLDYVKHTKWSQELETLGGYGEPKFHVDGKPV